MIERPLLTPDELKSLPKGDFIVMKTGAHPMRVHLKLFFKWGIEFDEDNPYAVPDQGNREVKYADKKEIQDGILEKYPPEWKEETPAPNSSDGGGQAQQDSQKNEPQKRRRTATAETAVLPSVHRRRKRNCSRLNGSRDYKRLNRNGGAKQ